MKYLFKLLIISILFLTSLTAGALVDSFPSPANSLGGQITLNSNSQINGTTSNTIVTQSWLNNGGSCDGAACVLSNTIAPTYAFTLDAGSGGDGWATINSTYSTNQEFAGITMNPGDSITFENDITIKFQWDFAMNGTLNINGNITIHVPTFNQNSGTMINISSGSSLTIIANYINLDTASVINSSDFVCLANNELNVNTGVQLKGLLYSNGTMMLNQDVILTGAATANELTLNSNAIINYDLGSIVVAPSVPFTCDDTSYVNYVTSGTFLTGEEHLASIDLAGGTQIADAQVNGLIGVTSLGYNVQDNYLWGYNMANKKIVRIDANYNSQVHNVAGMIDEIYSGADVSADGILHLSTNKLFYNNVANTLKIDRIDTTTATPTKLAPLTLNTSIDALDISFNPLDGNIYFIASDGIFYRIVISNGGTTGTVEVVGNTGLGAIYNVISYFDKDGTFYFNTDTTEIYKLTFDATGLTSTSPFSSLTTPLTQGDGARCPNAGVVVTAPNPCDANASGNTDTDGDNVSDICDLDDDNDGILDTLECPLTQTPFAINWGSTSTVGDLDWTTASILSTQSDPLTFGSGFTASIPSPAGPTSMYINGGADQATLAGAKLDNDYLEMAFTTVDGLDIINLTNFDYLVYFMDATGETIDQDFSYSIEISKDNFITSDTLVNSFYTHIGNTDSVRHGPTVNGAGTSYISYYKILNYPLNPNTSYKVRFYFYGDDDGKIIIDDPGFGFSTASCDTDSDGIVNLLDLDSDNDQISDFREANHDVSVVDANNDGIVDNMLDADNDGLADIVETVYGNDTGVPPIDSDGDGIFDIVDLDADNDGIPDAVEVQETVGYVGNDGNVSDDVNLTTGILLSGLIIPNVDADDTADTLADYIDIDSDGDGIIDSVESGLTLSGDDNNSDGIDDNINASYEDPDGDVNLPLSNLRNSDANILDVDYRSLDTSVLTPLSCTPNFYHMISKDLKLLDITDGTYSLIGTSSESINSMGWDIRTNIIYGIGRDTLDFHLVIIDNNGIAVDRGIPVELTTGVPFDKTNNAGDMDKDGNLYIRVPQGLAKIDVDTNTYEIITFSGGLLFTNIADIVYIEGTNSLWGVYNQTLYQWDLTTLTIKQTIGIDLPDGIYGAGYTDINKMLYVSNNDGGIYKIDDYTSAMPTTSLFSNSVVTFYNDGASCPDALAPSIPLDPCDANASGNTDTDGDNITDVCDLDDDNDGILDTDEGVGSATGKTNKIVFILDTSGSVSSIEYQGWTDSINTLSTELLNKNPQMQIAIVQYGTLFRDIEQSSANVSNVFSNTHPNWTLAQRDTSLGVSDFLPSSLVRMRDFWLSGGVLDLTDNSNNTFIIFTDAEKESVGSVLYNGNITPDVTALYGYGEYEFLKTTYNATVIVSHASATSIGGYEAATAISSVDENGTSLAQLGTFSLTSQQIETIVENSSISSIDSDNDSIPNHLDLDSDNDQISDFIEANHNVSVVDANNDGMVDNMLDADNDGLADIVETVYGNDTGVPPIDSDGDSIFDIVDLDADNDGIPDAIEVKATVGYVGNDGNVSDDVNLTTGILLSGLIVPNVDADDTADTLADYIDIDSDGDGIIDSVESGLTLSGDDNNSDGIDDAINASYEDPDGDVNTPLSDLTKSDVNASDVDYRSIGVIVPPPSTTCGLVATSIMPSGNRDDAGNGASIVAFDYDTRGRVEDTPALIELASAKEVGTVWGKAYDGVNKKLYASAFLRRHADISPDGLGAIYEIDVDTKTTSLFMNLNSTMHLGATATLFPNETATNRNLGSAFSPSHDVWAFNRVGKQGLGGLEISNDLKTLYAVDLTNRQLLTIDIASKAVTNRYPITNPGCAGGAGDIRPFGVDYLNGEVYVGVTCSGETNNDYTQVDTHVMRLSGGLFTTVVSGAKGEDDLSEWSNDPYLDPTKSCTDIDTNTTEWNHYVPIISNMQLDKNGNMIIGVVGINGFRFATANYPPDTSCTKLINNHESMGFFIQATPSGSNWTIAATETDSDSYEHSTSTRFFKDGQYADWGGEGAVNTYLGGLAVTDCSGQEVVIGNIMDALNYEDASTRYIRTADGQNEMASNVGDIDLETLKSSSRQLYADHSSHSTWEKSSGVGDIEFLAAPTPLPSAKKVAEYRFDACDFTGLSIIDSSGNGFDGVIVGDINTTNDAMVSRAAQFNGGAFDVNLSTEVNNTIGAKTTVSFWMHWNGNESSGNVENWGQIPISWGDGDSSYNLHIDLVTDGIPGSGLRIGFNTFDSDNYGVDVLTYANGWHHIVAIFENGDAEKSRLYIDKIEQTLTQAPTRSPINSRAYVGNKLRIGGVKSNSDNEPYAFKDYMDEVKIYSGALTSGEISTIYNNEANGKSWDGTVRAVLDCTIAVPVPFACDDTLYLSNRNILGTGATDGKKTWLHSINRNATPHSYTAIGNEYISTDNGYNALGYNTKDNFMYAMDGNMLLKIDKNAVVENLGVVAGIPYQLYAGEFDRDGNYYVSGGGGDSTLIYQIDVNTSTVTKTITMSQAVRFWDMAIDETGKYFYVMLIADGDADSSFNNYKFSKIEIASGIITEIGNDKSALPSYISLVFADIEGKVFMMSNENGFYMVNTLTGDLQLLSLSQDLTFYNDGTSCSDANISVPLLISIDDVIQTEGDAGTKDFNLTVSFSRTPLDVGGIDFTYQVFNASNADDEFNAHNPEDYTAFNFATAVTLNDASQTYTINIPVNGDTKMERNEQFIVRLSNEFNAVIVDNIGLGTIINDDLVRFNVERTNSDTVENATEEEKQSLYTQITGRDFNYAVVAYDENTTIYTETGVKDITLKVELFDNNTTTVDNKLYEGYLYFPLATAQTRVIENLNDDLKVAIATRNARYKISYLVDGNGSIIYGDYTNEVDYNSTKTSTLGANEQSRYSLDNFAIRPAHYRMELQDTTEYNNSSYLINDVSTEVKLASGYSYNLLTQATLIDNDTLVPEYKTFNPKELNVTLLFNDKATCNDTSDCKLSEENKFNYIFNNGELQGATISHDNVGAYILHVEDINYSYWDKSDLTKVGCIMDSATNTPDVTGKIGCNIASDIGAGYNDMNLKFQPYDFNISNTKLSNANKNGKNHLYMGDLAINKGMSVLITTDILAQDKNGKQLSNFTSSCVANEILLSFNYNASTIAGENSTKADLNVHTIKGTPVNIQLLRDLDDANGTVRTSQTLSDLSITANNFLDKNEGNTTIKFFYNIQKNLNEPINPLSITVNTLEVNSSLSASNALGEMMIPKGTNGSGVILNAKRTFYFSRLSPDQEDYPMTYGTEELTPIGVEIFCDKNTSWCSNILDSNGIYTETHGWYTARNHNNTTDGSIHNFIETNATNINVEAFSEGRISNVVTKRTAGTDDLDTRVEIETDIWLRYHPTSSGGVPYWTNHFRSTESSQWYGIGKMGNRLDNKTNTKSSAKMEW